MKSLNQKIPVQMRFSQPALPMFLAQRMDLYYQDLAQRGCDAGHPFRGQETASDSICLQSNDYLSLASHPEILRRQSNLLLKNGNGNLMSAIFLSAENPQRNFERKLANFMGMEDGIVCQSGWCANVGLLQSIANEATPVYLDMLAHMSLWEGVHSAKAKAIPFFHNDAEHLEKQILKNGPGVVVVDSVYSTNGSVCPLTDIVRICAARQCVIVVDESHSLGTHGGNGEGMVSDLGLTGQVHFITASLAKAFAGRGGFIACSTKLSDYVKFESKPAIFSSNTLPHEIEAFDATLDVIQRDAWRRDKLFENASYLRSALGEMGYNLQGSESQIIALEAGPERKTLLLRDLLENNKIFGAPFYAPATPKNRSLIRFSVNCSLTDADLKQIIEVCYRIREEIGLAEWPSTRRKKSGKFLLHKNDLNPAMMEQIAA
jgi:CAI-1 autoinducer synthase